MKYKRAMSSLLVAVMTFSLLSGCGNNHLSSSESADPIVGENAETTSTATYANAELARAVELGIGQYREPNNTITYAEFLEMPGGEKSHKYLHTHYTAKEKYNI